MADNVQDKQTQIETCLFHFSLTKLLVVEELRKKNQSWQAFLDSSNLTVEFPNNPWSKTDTPSSMVKNVPSAVEGLVKRPPALVDPSNKKKGKKLHFSPKVVEVPKKPIKRSAAKKLPMEQTLEQPTEVLDTIPEYVVSDDKDKEIVEQQEQLKKANLVIPQQQHDNKELKEIFLEKTPKIDEIEPAMCENSHTKAIPTAANMNVLHLLDLKLQSPSYSFEH